MKLIAEMSIDEIEYERARGENLIRQLAAGRPVTISDPAILDRAAAVFRAADPQVRAKIPRQTATA